MLFSQLTQNGMDIIAFHRIVPAFMANYYFHTKKIDNSQAGTKHYSQQT